MAEERAERTQSFFVCLSIRATIPVSLFQVADGRVVVLLRRLEVLKAVRSDVLREELLLVALLLQSHLSSLKWTVSDTRRAARGWRAAAGLLAALQRDDAERSIEAIYCLSLIHI